jgi:hypothetical protein
MGYEYDIFISYTRDELVTKWVHDMFKPTLEKHLKIYLPADLRIFDDKDIKVGESWPDKLKRGLTASKLLICILSPYYFRRKWCICEYETMRLREKQLKIPSINNPSGLIIPIVIQDGEYFPPEVLERQYYDFSEFLLEEFREYAPIFIKFQKEIKILAEDLNKILRNDNLIPDYDPSWLKDKFFLEDCFGPEELKESHIEIKRPRL